MMLLTYFLIAVGISFLCSILEAVLLSLTPAYIKVLKSQKEKVGKFKSDICRLFLLWEKGGVYLDNDLFVRFDLRKILDINSATQFNSDSDSVPAYPSCILLCQIMTSKDLAWVQWQ